MKANKIQANPIQASLAEFLWIWNRWHAMSTPALHLDMASWLNQCRENGDQKLLLMAFRGAGKSTLAAVYIGWLLWCRPELRILVIAAEQELANKMVRNVRRLIEQHPLTTGLKPKRPEEWAADRFSVNRESTGRDPSLLARGIYANITGARADLVLLDDVEVPGNCDSVLKRAELRNRISEIDYVLTPDGTQLYIGTPHHFFSIYARKARPEAGEDVAFLDGFLRKEIPIHDADGTPAWPERFGKTVIENLRRRHGPAKFMSQMMLQPVNSTRLRLNPDLLKPYEAELDLRQGNGETSLWLGEVRLVSASCWWDPAYGHMRPGNMRDGEMGEATRQEDVLSGDQSALACVFTGVDGRFYIHRVIYLTVDPDQPLDPARQQCQAIARFLEACFLPAVTVESNGIGRFLPALLRQELDKSEISAAVVSKASRQSKAARILEAFDAPLAAGQLSCHQDVLAGPLAVEMREWRPDGKGHDDALDATAGALLAEPVRLPRFVAPRAGIGRARNPARRSSLNWRQGKAGKVAASSFNPFSGES